MPAGDIQVVSVYVVIVLLLLALYSDLRHHRIPNWLNATALLFGVGLYASAQGAAGLLLSLAAALMGLLAFLPFYAKGAMGAGDVKLMAAVCSLLGPRLGVLAIGATLAFGGIFALVIYVRGDGVQAVKLRFVQMAKVLFTTGQFVYVAPAQKSSALLKFPYSTAIAAGAVSALCVSGQLGGLPPG